MTVIAFLPIRPQGIFPQRLRRYRANWHAVLIVLAGQGLTMRFGGLITIVEVDFELRRGEILDIIGPNGVGKSTLLNIITGTYVPGSVEVLLLDDRRPAWTTPSRTP